MYLQITEKVTEFKLLKILHTLHTLRCQLIYNQQISKCMQLNI